MLHSDTFGKTAGKRLALQFSLIFAVGAAVVLLGLYFLVTWEFRSRLQGRVVAIQSELIRLSFDKGFDAVARTIETNARVAQQAEIVYILLDNKGNFVAGNVSAAPSFDGWQTTPWSQFKLKGSWSARESDEGVIGSWTTIDRGRLMVGIGNGDIIEAGDIIADAFLAGVALSSLIGVIGGIILGWKADRSIYNIGATLNAVSVGDLHARIPIKGTDGDLRRVSGLVNEMLDRMQILIGRLRDVSADIAHDLRTPISHVKHSLEFISANEAMTDEVRDRAEAASEELQSVLATFEAILRTSEIESGLGKNRFCDVDLASVVRDVVDAFSPIAEEAGHVLASNVSAEAVRVHGDPELLRQLLANIVGNSIEHCPRGTRTDVTISVKDSSIDLCVSDNGPGIPESDRTAVFRRHKRLQSDRSTPGFGIGLNMVSAISQLHDAKISLEDNKPGLKFSVRFPSIWQEWDHHETAPGL